MRLKTLPLVGLNLFLAVVYYAAAELGLSLASLHSNVTPVWPPAGIAIASLLIFGRQLWPGIFLGALAANLPTNIPAISAVGIAVGNTAQALIAYWLLFRVVRWRGTLESVNEVLRFVLCAALLAPFVSATIGSLSLCLGGAAEWNRFTQLWLTWLMGDGFGALIVAPLLLSWSKSGKLGAGEWPELASLFLLLMIVVLMVFAGWFPGAVKTYPLAYLCLPCLLWAALRFDQRMVTTSIVVMAALAVWGAGMGYGPFVQRNPNVALLLLISFVGTSSLMALVVGAVMNERRRAQAEKEKLVSGLEAQRRRIEDIVAHVPGVVWEAWGKPGSANYRTEFVSSHIGKMLAYSAEEWLANPQFGLQIVHPDDRERTVTEAAAIFASGKGGSSRFRLMHKDGREVWVEAQSIVVC